MANVLPKQTWMDLWVKHGGPAADADTFGAIVMAESGGDADARNGIGATGGPQIYNGPGTSLKLKDPDTAVDAAVAKYKAAGNKFTPWTTFTGADTPGHEKTYLKFLGDTAAPAATGADYAGRTGSASTDATGGSIWDPLLSGATKALVWIGLLLGGTVLFVIGAGRIAGATSGTATA